MFSASKSNPIESCLYIHGYSEQEVESTGSRKRQDEPKLRHMKTGWCSEDALVRINGLTGRRVDKQADHTGGKLAEQTTGCNKWEAGTIGTYM